MKDSVKDSMKDSWTFIGLVALSILYLFEVDVTRLTWLNGAAFVIIAVTLVPLLISIIRKITAFVKRRKEKKPQNGLWRSQIENLSGPAAQHRRR